MIMLRMAEGPCWEPKNGVELPHSCMLTRFAEHIRSYNVRGAHDDLPTKHINLNAAEDLKSR
jgi:hypothetical protein